MGLVKPELFACSFNYNPKNFFYLKTSIKRRSNKVGADHSSAALLENAIGDDQVLSFKVGQRIARISAEDGLMNNHVGKASAEFITSDQSQLVKAKVFARYTRKIGSLPFYGQIGFNAGMIKKLNDSCLRVNDAFYLPNFKGIRNLGYHFDAQAKKKGLGGDILGFDKYATLNLKLAQINCPLLAEFSIEPFIFANFALAPNRNSQKNEGAATTSTWLSKHLRWSTGIGLSLQPANVAIECYYNIHVSRQKNELRNDFQINIGID